VSQRLPHDDEIEFSVWNHKRAPRFETSRRVIVAHADRSVGESIALILGLKGFTALYAKDFEMARVLLGSWDPQVLLIDTRLETSFGFAFTETFAADPAHADRFLIAMTDIISEEPVEALKAVGFDGLCRRPCPVWKLADMLNQYFGSTAS
jgi:DNA-binding response OmpR family regulator